MWDTSSTRAEIYEGRNKATGRECDSAMVWTVENGKAVAFQEYTDTEAFAILR
jgi:ketosteroid isomerase-like protein